MHEKMETSNDRIEVHPFEPFLFEGAKVLMLGTFPPKPERWSMPFYYPNKINDMWRVMGLVFFGNKDYFTADGGKGFRLEAIKCFLKAAGIAMYDTARSVVRERDNASDKYLRIVEPADIKGMLRDYPSIATVVTAGEKAAATAAAELGVMDPGTGCYVTADIAGRSVRLYRMPSTSRAYPLALEKKAEAYAEMFEQIGVKLP